MFYYVVVGIKRADGSVNADCPVEWSGYYYAPENAFLIKTKVAIPTPWPITTTEIISRADLEAACVKYGVSITDVDRLFV